MKYWDCDWNGKCFKILNINIKYSMLNIRKTAFPSNGLINSIIGKLNKTKHVRSFIHKIK